MQAFWRHEKDCLKFGSDQMQAVTLSMTGLEVICSMVRYLCIDVVSRDFRLTGSHTLRQLESFHLMTKLFITTKRGISLVLQLLGSTEATPKVDTSAIESQSTDSLPITPDREYYDLQTVYMGLHIRGD